MWRLLPRHCVFCGIAVREPERYICSPCDAELPWIDRRCATCAMPLPTAHAEPLPCAACQRDPPPFTSAVAPLHYAFPVDAAIKAMKFRRKLHYQPAFSAILLATAARLPGDIDALLPVPLHRWRQLARGFNQAEELARPLARALSIKRLRGVRRVTHTPFQSGLGRVARRRNLKDAFRVVRPVLARHVLIVDDVITSGETCRQLAGVVLEAGAERVSVLALARAVGNDVRPAAG